VWVVRGWQPDMVTWVLQQEGTLREVQDLDLEEAFVELLRSARGAARRMSGAEQWRRWPDDGRSRREMMFKAISLPSGNGAGCCCCWPR
jgi:hypothetical protein